MNAIRDSLAPACRSLLAVLFCAMAASAAQAEAESEFAVDDTAGAAASSAPAPGQTQAEPPTKLRWSYGIRFRIGDLSDAKGTARIRPALGLRWGRWRMGTVEQTAVDSPTSSQRQPSLGYQWLESDAWNVQTSVRLHNVSTNEGAEALSGGTYTARGRVLASHKINADWAVMGEATLDLLRRGDGVTASLGVGHTLMRGQSVDGLGGGPWAIGASAGVVWGSATHWQTAQRSVAERRIALGQSPLRMTSGLGELGLGISYSQKLNKNWALSTGLSHAIPIGQIRREITSKGVTGFSLGLQRYQD